MLRSDATWVAQSQVLFGNEPRRHDILGPFVYQCHIHGLSRGMLQPGCSKCAFGRESAPLRVRFNIWLARLRVWLAALLMPRGYWSRPYSLRAKAERFHAAHFARLKKAGTVRR